MKIKIKGLKLFAYHGVREHEKQNGQVFLLDIKIWADVSAACQSDDLNDTVNYSAVADCAAAAFCAERHDLIERAANVTADAILKQFPLVQRLNICVHKPDAPLRHAVADITFELEKERNT